MKTTGLSYKLHYNLEIMNSLILLILSFYWVTVLYIMKGVIAATGFPVRLDSHLRSVDNTIIVRHRSDTLNDEHVVTGKD